MGFDVMGTIDWNAVLATTMTVLKVAAGLGFVIFVHELGHFLVAKACGVKCEKFYIGFDIPMPFGIPSRLWRVQWGETEYGIGILPLGGYVKMLGQDDNPMNAEEEAERTRLRRDAEGTPAAPVAESSTPPLAPAAAGMAPAVATTAADTPFTLDPRSYPAKAVWQRMLIISAGVVMNLIFAVIFAAFAYRNGVPYTPCEIGQVLPGGPAWQAGVEPQTRIVQIGEDGKRRDELRFDFDLRQSIYTHGDKSDLALLFRNEQGEENWKHVRPFTIRHGLESSSTIGIAPSQTLTLIREQPVREESAAAKASPALQPGDRIVAVDGQKVEGYAELQEHLLRFPDRTLTLRVERSSASQGGDENASVQVRDLRVEPERVKELGLIMQHGPITAIRPDSPAAKAGLRPGDVIREVQGKPIGDPMLLPELLRPHYDQEVDITYERSGQSSPQTLRVQLEMPRAFHWNSMFGSPMAADSLGIAYPVNRTVRDVVPDSPAAKAGLQAGDVITKFSLSWKEPRPDREPKLSHGEILELDDHQFTWPACYAGIQRMVSGEVVNLTFERGGKVMTAALEPVDSEAFNPDRGFHFKSHNETHLAGTWGEAIHLGMRQTWEDAFRVVGVLKKLVTGRVSVANLGGLGSIAYVAGSEASQGTTRLLIFLTMLSANLAVLNFLPIPALDGGHMMFLTYEGIFRKPVNERLQFALTIAGVACLLGLMIFVNAMDVKRFLF